MKRKILSMALLLAVCLSLLPTAALAADDKVEQVYDVYQGDGFYITARPYTLKSTKYTMGNSHDYNFDGRFHDGMIAVWTANVDENYVNRQFVQEYNFADKDGNILFPEGLFHGDYYIYNKHEGDMAPSEGMIPFWDGETKGGSNSHPLLGFVDYSGKEVIACQYLDDTITPFREGLSNVFRTSISVGSLREGEGFIDKSGSLVISADDIRGIYIRDDASFSDGLVPCSSYGGDVTTCGYMDTSGNWALKLLSYNDDDVRDYASDYGYDYWKMYADGKTDGYLMPFESVFKEGDFSDGYTVCYDLRSGNKLDYNFAIIDKSGNVVGTFSDAEPYGSGFHDGLLRVQFIDNRGNGAGCGFVNTKGEVVIRESDCANPTVGWAAGGNTNKGYSCGLLVVRGRIVADTKGNTVIPEGAFESMRPFDNDLAIGFLSPECGGAIDWGMGILSTPYVFEKHDGTYTGAGKVYNAAKGGAQTPAQPSGNLAYASTQSVTVDGKAVSFEMYALKDAAGNPTNYIKLRDIASVVNGTKAQFEVGWNGAVNIETGKPYTANGSEMSTPYSGDRAYTPATAVTNVNGSAAGLEAIVLTDDNGGAYTYYKLRDLGRALGFNVGWSAEKGVFVETDKPYSE